MKPVKPRQLLIFVALLLSWVQAIASPLQCCGDNLAPVPTPAPIHVHADHHMMMDHEGMAEHMMLASTAVAQHIHNLHHSHPAADCNMSCQFCRGASITNPVSLLGIGAPLMLTWKGSSPVSFVAAAPPADHFRPPAAA